MESIVASRTGEVTALVGRFASNRQGQFGLSSEEREDMQQDSIVLLLEAEQNGRGFDSSRGNLSAWAFHATRPTVRDTLKRRDKSKALPLMVGQNDWEQVERDELAVRDSSPVSDYLTGNRLCDSIIVGLSEGKTKKIIARELGIGVQKVRAIVSKLRKGIES